MSRPSQAMGWGGIPGGGQSKGRDRERGPDLAPAVLAVGVSHGTRVITGWGSSREAGPGHRGREKHVRELNSILKVGAGPKNILRMGCVGDSI